MTSDVELVFCIDNDDQTWPQYPQTWHIFGPPTGDPTGPLNRASTSSEYVGFMGDDSRFFTQGWDLPVLAQVRGHILWPDDGHDIPWPTTVFMDARIPKALGYMVPPTLHRGFFDVFWMTLAQMTGIGVPLPDIFIPHDNSKGDPKSPNFDPAFRVPQDVIAADERAFHKWRAEDAESDARKIRIALDL